MDNGVATISSESQEGMLVPCIDTDSKLSCKYGSALNMRSIMNKIMMTVLR